MPYESVGVHWVGVVVAGRLFSECSAGIVTYELTHLPNWTIAQREKLVISSTHHLFC